MLEFLNITFYRGAAAYVALFDDGLTLKTLKLKIQTLQLLHEMLYTYNGGVECTDESNSQD